MRNCSLSNATQGNNRFINICVSAFYLTLRSRSEVMVNCLRCGFNIRGSACHVQQKDNEYRAELYQFEVVFACL